MNTANLYKLIWMSRPLMQAAEASVEQNLQGTGLTVRMRAVLEMLHLHEQLTVPEIARHMDINRQYVQVMVNETLAAGLTVRKQNVRHKRSVLLALTDSGRSLISEAIEREQAFLRELGSDLSDQDVEIALRVVMDVTDALKSKMGELR